MLLGSSVILSANVLVKLLKCGAFDIEKPAQARGLWSFSRERIGFGSAGFRQLLLYKCVAYK